MLTNESHVVHEIHCSECTRSYIERITTGINNWMNEQNLVNRKNQHASVPFVSSIEGVGRLSRRSQITTTNIFLNGSKIGVEMSNETKTHMKFNRTSGNALPTAEIYQNKH